MAKTNTSTGGRAATTGIIPGKWALSVGKPSIPAPPGFNWTPLSEIARLESGHTPSRRNPEYWDGNVPWIGIRDATGNHGRTITSTLQTITQAGLDNSSARLLPAGTVCLSRTASVGYVVTMGAPMATSQDFINWVCGPKLSPRYLHYILVMEQDSVRRFAHGTTHQTVYYPEAKAFHVCIPNREEQNRIASMLGALDDKIAVNERITATADELARTHFRAGFSLALDYVTDGTSLPPEWAVSTIGDSATTVETGIRPKGGVAQYTSGTPSIGAESIIGLGKFDFTKTKFVPENFFADMRRGIIQDLDILVYKDGGKPGDFKPHVTLFGKGFPFSKMCINEHVYRVRMASSVGQEFGYYWLSSVPVMAEMRRRGTGAAIPGMNSSAFKSIPLVVPPSDKLASFTDAAAPLVDRALMAAVESRTLATLRDTLLPQLMSGRLRVKDAEKIVEDNT
ncbi:MULTISPECIES: restriction endonuclease subunit S [Streptomyces]|uniref:restriction endonuclease subunit S n=1 Tax=Streptomyces TaxID=1883 RepID=UPI001436C966|nr:MULTISPECIES: restriction endonuclease subunit S [Streptomyces]MBV7250532.1 restriction endonuclease subunit S [Streptomyces sp. S-2]